MNDTLPIEPKPVKAIVFDLYNTLIEVQHRLDPYRRLLRHLEFTHSEIKTHRRSLMTQPLGSFPEISNWLAPGQALPDYDFDKDLRVEINSTRCFPETREILQALQQKYPLFLLSNITTHFKAPFYRLGLEPYFKKTFFSSDLGAIKPEAAVFEHICKTTGFSPSEMLMVGDSLRSDFEGANAAGWQAILLDRRNKHPDQPSIPDLRPLSQLIQ